MITNKRIVGILGSVLLLVGVLVPMGILGREAWFYTSAPGLALLIISSFIKK